MPESPWWCQDDTCVCVRKTHECEMGGSQFCSGAMAEEHTIEKHGVPHCNDYHFCTRTPFRGVIMLEVNDGDLHWMLILITRCLARINGPEDTRRLALDILERETNKEEKQDGRTSRYFTRWRRHRIGLGRHHEPYPRQSRGRDRMCGPCVRASREVSGLMPDRVEEIRVQLEKYFLGVKEGSTGQWFAALEAVHDLLDHITELQRQAEVSDRNIEGLVEAGSNCAAICASMERVLEQIKRKCQYFLSNHDVEIIGIIDSALADPEGGQE